MSGSFLLRRTPRCSRPAIPADRLPAALRFAIVYWSTAEGGFTMRRWATLAIGALAFCAFPVTGPAQAQTGEGWTTLFDGKDLNNWQGDGNAQFAIEDGAIVANGKKDPKDTAFLISKDKYKDFQVYAEFWVSNDANSGIFIRCEDPKKPGAKTCYECNIYDTRPDPSYGTGAIVYHAEVNPMP